MAALQDKIAKAEKLLKQSEMCRKLETEEEKVLPFYQETITAADVEKAAGTGGGVVFFFSAPPPPHSLTPEYEHPPLPPGGDGAAAAAARAPPEPTQPHASMCNERNEPVSDIEALSNFWKRYNKVLLDKLAMEKERSTLSEENEQLRQILKQYLDGISVSEEVLANDNTLMVINGRTNAQPTLGNVPVGDSRVRSERPVVVEATQVMRTQRLAQGGRR